MAFLISFLGMLGSTGLFFAIPSVLAVMLYELAVLQKVRIKIALYCITALLVPITPITLIALASSLG